MSEENIKEQPGEGATESDSVDINAILEENKMIKAELENQKKIASGQDKKNTELFEQIKQLQKVVSEKDMSKKSIEEQMEELRNELKERDNLQKIAEKRAEVSKIIAEHKLDPEFDFDYLMKFETIDIVKEKAKARAEKYDALKEEGFKERAGGTAPKKGESIQNNNFENMNLLELNKLANERPDLIPQIAEAIKNRKKG